MDNTAGIYTDDFTDNTKVPTRSYVNVNAVEDVLQLTSSASQTTFTTPYRAEGYAITSVIKPLIIAQWDTLTINSTIPENTTLKVQILSDYNTVWQNEYMPGNEEGFDVSTNPTIDISTVPVMGCAFDPTYGVDWGCDKTSSIKIKFLMTTSDDLVTPSINDISVSWTVRQGDLTATTFSQDPWPTDRGNQQQTSYSQYYNESIYPAFKWLSTTHSQDPYYSQLYVLNDRLVGFASNSFSRLFALDRNTGQELWKIQGQYFNNGPGVIGSDGTIYAHEMLGDAVKAVDTNTGQIKWLYNWMGGHGSGLTLADNGKLYYFRDSATSANATLYEHNPDGTIESQTSLNLVPEGLSSENKFTRSPILGSNNTLYFNTIVSQSVSPWGVSDKGRLFAIDLGSKTLEWSYLANINDIIVGPEGTIYASSYTGYSPASDDEKKLYAFNPDGTLKWEATRSIDGSRGFISELGLTDTGLLISGRYVAADDWSTTVIEFTDCNDGSLVNSINPSGTFSTLQFIDGLNGFYYSSSETIDSEISLSSKKMIYSDATGNLKWRIIYPYFYSEEGKDIWANLSKLVPDERGWLYGTITRDSNDLEWNRIPEDSYAKTYALAPWTLSVKTDRDAYKAGDTVRFTATTSMLRTNPVFGGDNEMQVLMGDGTKVPLSYYSIDSNGNTIWTGEYILSNTVSKGNYTYTVEAAQTHLKTDTNTHFDYPPTQTENSGIVLSSSIEVVVPYITITDIGLITNIVDKDSLKYYFTSTRPVIKGVTQANSTVTFKYGSKTYTTQADSKGIFEITIENPTLLNGTNNLEYWSTDVSGNRSITKTLTLIIGSENFPEWLLDKLGLIMNTVQDDAETQEEDVVEEEIIEDPVEEQEDTYTPSINNTRKIKFTDKRGRALTQATVEIDGNTYITDDNGEIEIVNLENRTYTAKIKTKDGKEYSMDILGVGDESESMVVEVAEENGRSIDWVKILIYSGIGIVTIVLLGILISSKKK